jgi:hypothetical protein
MAEGCDYFSRDKGNMGRHAAAKHNHGMVGSAGADPSSSASSSSMAPGSSKATPSSSPDAHGALGGSMAEIRRRFTAAGTVGGMDTGEHYMGGSSSYVTGDARK